ncbi:MAG: tRNA (5-methylaminomethyl-2-thiouridine)(34)-methyltransferase MnmD [Bacteroidota bacterium]
MSDPQIIITSDGSHSLYNPELKETYHSVHGALQESIHVFIKHGFNYFFEQSCAGEADVFEVGFGTGLNALLTLQEIAGTKRKIRYTAVEAFPISLELSMQLNYASSVEAKELFRKLHTALWDRDEMITTNFSLLKLKTTLQEFAVKPSSYDIIFFDAFAPGKQPDMWELPVLRKVAQSMKPGSVFVTYCAKGQLKRDLKTLGLAVETLAGPPGKKEMIRAVKR